MRLSPLAEMAKLFALISHEAVTDGALDRYGERMFTMAACARYRLLSRRRDD